MAKKKIDVDASTPTTHNPFGALKGLTALPPQEPASTPEETAPEQKSVQRSKVVVRRETKGRKGKTITRVKGLEDAESVRVGMKRAIGCGATIEEGDLILLGNVGDAAESFLVKRGFRVVRG